MKKIAILCSGGDCQGMNACIKAVADTCHSNKIELIGVVTNICVISNAVIVKTMLPNADIVVDALCSSSFDEEMENKSLDILKNLHIRVTK